MQQQQYHACSNSNITHATTAISRMQQQQYHACNNNNIMHATTVISHMQEQQYHTSNITHATTTISNMQDTREVAHDYMCNKFHDMGITQCLTICPAFIKP